MHVQRREESHPSGRIGPGGGRAEKIEGEGELTRFKVGWASGIGANYCHYVRAEPALCPSTTGAYQISLKRAVGTVADASWNVLRSAIFARDEWQTYSTPPTRTEFKSSTGLPVLLFRSAATPGKKGRKRMRTGEKGERLVGIRS